MRSKLTWEWTKNEDGTWVGKFSRGWVAFTGSIEQTDSVDAMVVVTAHFIGGDVDGDVIDTQRVRRGSLVVEAMKQLAERMGAEIVRKKMLAFLDEKAPRLAASETNFDVALQLLAEDPNTPERLTRLRSLPTLVLAQYRLLRGGDVKALALKLAGKAIWRGLRLALVKLRRAPPLTPESGIRKSPGE